MDKPIKAKFLQLFKRTNTRKYEISHKGLTILLGLKPRSQKLFLELLRLTNSSCVMSAIVIEVSYKELGFKSASNYSKYKQPLIQNKLIISEGNRIFVNPYYVNYMNRNQMNYFYSLFGIRTDIKVRMEMPLRKAK